MILNIITRSKGFAPALFFLFVLSIFDSSVERKLSKSITLLIFSNGLPISDKRSIVNCSSNNYRYICVHIIAKIYASSDIQNKRRKGII